MKRRIVALSVFIAALSGCTAVVTREQINLALDNSKKCPENSRLGYCVRDSFDRYAPNWPEVPRAKFLAVLFDYLNAAGKRLEDGVWTRRQSEDEIKTFIIAWQQAVVGENRMGSEQAWQDLNDRMKKSLDSHLPRRNGVRHD
ncbi:MAG: hypothetical protein Q8O79_09515 [Pseudomonadota bacterium]|nr:hypothetical protein [Pseudomonadota bacterium]